jgi:hypothetical protein
VAGFAFNTTLQPRSGKRERLTVSSSAVGFTSSAFTIQPSVGATKYGKNDTLPVGAVLQVGSDAIYWTLDGSTPSASVGFESAAGDFIYLDSFQKIKEFKAIRKTGDTSIEVLFLYGN